QADVTNLSFLHQVSERPHSLFDGRIAIDAVLIIKIDVVEAEAFQAGFAGRTHILGLAVDAPRVGIGWVANDAELGSQNNLVARPAFNRLSDQHFVGVRTIHVGGV